MKRFGRRQSSGGGRPESLSEKVLRRQIEESYNYNNLSIDQLVDHLRATIPSYRRHKLQPFTRQVQKALQRINNTQPAKHNKSSDRDRPSTFNFDENEDDNKATSLQSPVRKRVKRTDRNEERLQFMETQYILRKEKGGQDQDRPSTSSSSSSSGSMSTSSDEEEDGAVSTSEDAVYGEKMEPEFDLMKSMLRTSYSGSKNTPQSKGSQEKNVELEVVNNRASKKVDFVDGDGMETSGLNSGRAKGSNDGGSDEKFKDGPKFKDLGGMNAVVDELKMEVIVPLYHPQLPRWLGVRPMAGILLHGPPGCGKTKLAHAIANETGVPFYKISATELVSGVSGTCVI